MLALTKTREPAAIQKYFDNSTSRASEILSGCPVIRPGQDCCSLVKEIAYGKNNPSWVEQEQLPRRRSVLRASVGPEFFEHQFQDNGQRKRLPEFA
jgi:hypothetical protein